MQILINTLILIASFLFMELVAWFSHKYLMHGILWFMHRDHHQKPKDRFWEVNDLFFIIFALPGIILLYKGYSMGINSSFFWAGLGISLYGIVYLFIHDIAVHQRIRLFRHLDSVYLRAVRKAHKIHHKHLEKKNGENFGFVFVSAKYLKEARKRKNK